MLENLALGIGYTILVIFLVVFISYLIYCFSYLVTLKYSRDLNTLRILKKDIDSRLEQAELRNYNFKHPCGKV